jgi:hypothetical protein
MLRAELQPHRRHRRLPIDVERPVAVNESTRIAEDLEAFGGVVLVPRHSFVLHSQPAIIR